MPASLIEIRDLRKSYSNAVEAVRGVSFSIPPGICFGLLGPNGAGKTTTIEMMEGITAPTAGEIFFKGKPIQGDESHFKERCGIQFQSTALPDHLTVIEVLRLFRAFYPDPVSDPGLEKILDFCDLRGFLNQETTELSGGQRQRALLALALINDPEILFLDEPTTGLDPGARRMFWDLVRALRDQGKTLVLTTHYMEEAYALCDEIAIMVQGRIIAQGAPDRLLSEHFKETLVELPGIEVPAPEATPTHRLPPFRAETRQGSSTLFTQDVNATLKWLLDRGYDLRTARLRPPSLEDLFLEVITRK